jgi:hypothetical protein
LFHKTNSHSTIQLQLILNLNVVALRERLSHSLFSPMQVSQSTASQGLISLLGSQQGFLCPNTKPNQVNFLHPEFFFKTLDNFFKATQSLQYTYVLTVLFYKYFLNTDKVKLFFRLVPAS